MTEDWAGIGIQPFKTEGENECYIRVNRQAQIGGTRTHALHLGTPDLVWLRSD